MRSLRIVVLVCLMLVVSLPVFAGEKTIEKEKGKGEAHVVVEVHPRPVNVHIDLLRDAHTPRLMAFDWYKIKNDYGIGLKYQLHPDYFGTFNVEYNDLYDDLYFGFGAIYRIPKQIILWHFYLGGEYTFSRNALDGNPYVIIGTDFLIFFAESKYSLTPYTGNQYRSGLRFYF